MGFRLFFRGYRETLEKYRLLRELSRIRENHPILLRFSRSGVAGNAQKATQCHRGKRALHGRCPGLLNYRLSARHQDDKHFRSNDTELRPRRQIKHSTVESGFIQTTMASYIAQKQEFSCHTNVYGEITVEVLPKMAYNLPIYQGNYFRESCT